MKTFYLKIPIRRQRYNELFHCIIENAVHFYFDKLRKKSGPFLVLSDSNPLKADPTWSIFRFKKQKLEKSDLKSSFTLESIVVQLNNVKYFLKSELNFDPRKLQLLQVQYVETLSKF